MFLLRHRCARPWMLLAAMVWLFASFVTQWHEIAVPHVRCPEHGELVEIAAHDRTRGPEIAAAPDDPHHDACEMQVIGAPPLAVVGAPEFAPEVAPPDEVLALASIRLASHALRFAPKTSPPIA